MSSSISSSETLCTGSDLADLGVAPSGLILQNTGSTDASHAVQEHHTLYKNNITHSTWISHTVQNNTTHSTGTSHAVQGQHYTQYMQYKNITCSTGISHAVLAHHMQYRNNITRSTGTSHAVQEQHHTQYRNITCSTGTSHTV